MNATAAYAKAMDARSPYILNCHAPEHDFHLRPRRFKTEYAAICAIIKDQTDRAAQPDRDVLIDFQYDIIHKGHSIMESPISINALWKARAEQEMRPQYLFPSTTTGR